VLVGHRDTREQGPGVLYRLGDLDQGDEIQIVNDDWTTLRYEVRSREVLQKSAFPGEELFRRDGAPVLTLITCGGEYVEGRGYSENVVITAVPLDPAA
jgi:sortase (surface protein transpeptidase)